MTCTLHISLEAKHFLNYTKYSEFTTLYAQVSMEIFGKVDVTIEWVLKDRSVTFLHVHNVLHLPILGYPQSHWRKGWTKGHSVFRKGNYISLNKEPKVIFEVVDDGNLNKICKILQSTQITYNIWQQAIKQLALSSMHKVVKIYSDANTSTNEKDCIS